LSELKDRDKVATVDLQTYLRRAGTWQLGSTDVILVSPAKAVLSAALASPTPPGGIRGGSMATLAEAALLQSYLSVGDPGPLRWTNNLDHSPPHLQRFLTQSAAIALTVQLAGRYGWDWAADHRLFWFDDLKHAPAALKRFRPKKGPFPDVLFETPTGWISLESRGRSVQAPFPTKVPNSEETKRLGQLTDWADSVQRAIGFDPKWAMGWAWFGQSETRIDFFDPGEPLELSATELDELETYAQRVDNELREALLASAGRRRIAVRDTYIDAAIATSGEPERDEVHYAGIAVGALAGPRRREAGVRPDFDVIQYRGLIYFAGRIARANVGSVEEIVASALDEELDLE
jgi:hypothetical protein